MWGCRGLEKALDQIEAERGESTEAAIQLERQAQGLARSDSAEKERDVRRVVMREKRQAAWRHLSLTERDMLTVLSAVCKVPSPAPPRSHTRASCEPERAHLHTVWPQLRWSIAAGQVV